MTTFNEGFKSDIKKQDYLCHHSHSGYRLLAPEDEKTNKYDMIRRYATIPCKIGGSNEVQ